MIRKLLAFAAMLTTAPVLAQSYTNQPAAIASNFTIGDDIQSSSSTVTDTTGEAKYRFQCEDSHSNWDDPLLFPNLQSGNPHSHRYYGNTGTNYASTYTSLRSTGEGTCWAKRLNRSAYWVPDVYTDATHIKKADSLLIYYQTARENLPGGANAAYNTFARLPRSVSMITGYKPGDPTYEPPVTLSAGEVRSTLYNDGFAGWSCVSGGGFYADLANVGLNCAAGDPLEARFTFPSCWNGTEISSANQRTHIVQPVQDNNLGITRCPVSHPYRFFEIFGRALYSHNGPTDYRNWYLSSDRQDVNPANWVANGTSYHADYFEAWDDDIRDTLTAKCTGIATPLYTARAAGCESAQFGDLRQGDTDNVDTSTTVDAQNIILAPVRASALGTRIRIQFRRR